MSHYLTKKKAVLYSSLLFMSLHICGMEMVFTNHNILGEIAYFCFCQAAGQDQEKGKTQTKILDLKMVSKTFNSALSSPEWLSSFIKNLNSFNGKLSSKDHVDLLVYAATKKPEAIDVLLTIKKENTGHDISKVYDFFVKGFAPNYEKEPSFEEKVDYATKKNNVIRIYSNMGNPAEECFTDLFENVFTLGLYGNILYRQFDAVFRHKHENMDHIIWLLMKYNSNIQDSYGNTMLHVACKNNNEEVVDLLLTSDNIDVNIKNSDGKTPLDYANQHKRTEIIKKLRPRIKLSEKPWKSVAVLPYFDMCGIPYVILEKEESEVYYGITSYFRDTYDDDNPERKVAEIFYKDGILGETIKLNARAVEECIIRNNTPYIISNYPTDFCVGNNFMYITNFSEHYEKFFNTFNDAQTNKNRNISGKIERKMFAILAFDELVSVCKRNPNDSAYKRDQKNATRINARVWNPDEKNFKQNIDIFLHPYFVNIFKKILLNTPCDQKENEGIKTWYYWIETEPEKKSDEQEQRIATVKESLKRAHVPVSKDRYIPERKPVELRATLIPANQYNINNRANNPDNTAAPEIKQKEVATDINPKPVPNSFYQVPPDTKVEEVKKNSFLSRPAVRYAVIVAGVVCGMACAEYCFGFFKKLFSYA